MDLTAYDELGAATFNRKLYQTYNESFPAPWLAVSANLNTGIQSGGISQTPGRALLEAGVIGALVFIALVWILRRWRRGRKKR